MNASLILSSYKRPELLNLGLLSLTQHKISHNLEIIVLNDGIIDDTEKVCNIYKSKLNIKYIFTGQRNIQGKMRFRTPAFPFNIGIKQSQGDIIIISSPEIFHLNNSIDLIIEPLISNTKIMSTPKFISFDNNGEIRNHLFKKHSLDLSSDLFLSLESNTSRCKYASKLPFCMGLYKKELIDIGGYDEDFTGWAGDDDDIVNRLLLNGLSYYYVDAKIIHLYHDKHYNKKEKMQDKAYLHNLQLLKDRKGIIIRNQNKDWGKL